MGEMRWVAAVVAPSGGPEIEPRVIGDVTRIEDQEEGTATFPVHGVLGGGDAWSSSALSCLKS